MPIIYRDVIQGTPDWSELRCGIPTASNFSRIITPKGEPSKSAEMYLYELLAERITGEPTVEFTSHWMDRGSELERDAVAFFELTEDSETEKVGFILNDARTIGASPDRLVGEHGLLEIKVGKPATHVGYLMRSGTAYKEHMIQTQGQLWVAEREFNYLLAYNPALPPALYRVERDEKFIRLLEAAVMAFSGELEERFRMACALGWVKRPAVKERTMTAPEMMRAALIDTQK